MYHTTVRVNEAADCERYTWKCSDIKNKLKKRSTNNNNMARIEMYNFLMHLFMRRVIMRGITFKGRITRKELKNSFSL